ncbi:DUF7230 family protein [Pseudogulbenkiania subflava]|uniref:Uncharacterized protein n=1 Tax=Pseudogulbenkiania subflava DSM 22618 TaxID=1123014 RepID=A0A1Y6CJB2_9NEIS|nr:hypothetical protein SAMN02745746_04065 [Pseudogulbenkiania subflava DSM 22618]
MPNLEEGLRDCQQQNGQVPDGRQTTRAAHSRRVLAQIQARRASRHQRPGPILWRLAKYVSEHSYSTRALQQWTLRRAAVLAGGELQRRTLPVGQCRGHREDDPGMKFQRPRPHARGRRPECRAGLVAVRKIDPLGERNTGGAVYSFVCRERILDSTGRNSMAKSPRTNPVAKFAQRLQRCASFTDRKKRAKQGYTKHKKQAGSFTLPPFLLT